MIPSKYTKYADDVISGRQVACLYIKQACQRYLDWFKRSDIEFRTDKADRVVKFIEMLTLYSGKTAGKNFLLEEWQKWIVYNIYGFYYKDTNTRVIRNVYISMSRKNGKSCFAAAMSLYNTIADNEMSAEVYFSANSSAQAALAFTMCKNFTEGLDTGKSKYFKRYRDSIKFQPTKSIIKVLSADTTLLDGLGPSMFVLDEAHAAKNSSMWDVLRSGQAARENPIAMIITTRGFLIGGFCHTLEKTYCDILANVIKDDRQFTAIYTLDDSDDWKDPNVWIKANPNLHVTVEPDYIKDQILQAEHTPSLAVGVMTKTLNLWVSSSEVWIPDNKIMESMTDFTTDEMRTDYSYVGIDLASVRDLTCVSFMTYKKDEDKYYFKTKIYLPHDTVSEGISTNSYQYQQWVNQGHIILTEGNVTDYNTILNDILEFNKQIPVYKLGYDTWNSSQFCIDAVSAGLPMTPFSQTLGSFNRPVKEFERLLYAGKIVIEPNPVVRWAFTNASLKYDNMENCKPVKDSKENKIDPVISMLEALGMKLMDDGYDTTITY